MREMAREKGKKLASSYREKGVKTNLETLFAGGNHCSDDPRVRLEVLRQDEDIRIWEIYTCPMASLWLDAGEAGLGTMYCEENQHGLVEGFTGGWAARLSSTWPVDELMLPSELTDMMSRSLRVKTSV